MHRRKQGTAPTHGAANGEAQAVEAAIAQNGFTKFLSSPRTRRWASPLCVQTTRCGCRRDGREKCPRVEGQSGSNEPQQLGFPGFPGREARDLRSWTMARDAA